MVHCGEFLKEAEIHRQRKRIGAFVKNNNFFNFLFREQQLEYASKYKYLGMYLNEFLDFSATVSVLAVASSRALGGIIGKIKELKNVTLKVFSRLYNSGVCPIMDYSAGVWGFYEHNSLDVIQHKAMRFFFGVCNFTPINA